MTTIHLVRHATHDLLDRVLTGRMPQVNLADQGRLQADKLAQHFRSREITAVQSSPRERAMQTAQPIAWEAGLVCETVPALEEIQIGEWTGQTFVALANDARWRAWNASRSAARAPGGESMGEVQARLMDHLYAMQAADPEGRIVMVSHADVIKAALLHVIGASLDAYGRLEIAPASISTIVIGPWGAKVLSMNEQVTA